MNNSNDTKGGVNRRDVLKGAAIAGLGMATGAIGAPNSAKPKRSDLIRKENAKPGTRDWQLTKTRTVPGKINNILTNGRCTSIEGYCSANSVRAGEKLKVMVSTNPVSDFKLEIFRTGYYGGKGGRLMKSFESIKGVTQPDPPVGENYVRECQWEPSVEFEIPKDWLSGEELAQNDRKAFSQIQTP